MTYKDGRRVGRVNDDPLSVTLARHHITIQFSCGVVVSGAACRAIVQGLLLALGDQVLEKPTVSSQLILWGDSKGRKAGFTKLMFSSDHLAKQPHC